MRVFSRRELVSQAKLLGAHHFCKRPEDIAELKLDSLLPKEILPTLEWSEKHRVIRKPDGTRTNWRRDRALAMIPIMDAHDNPDVREIIVPKPSRIGGTMIAENFAAKCFDCGPSWDVMWYLAGPDEVRSYADRVVTPLFEDHLADRIGRGQSDNNKTRKRVGTQTFELMVMSSKTTTNRQAAYIVFDEPDSYSRAFRSNFLEQGRQRQSDLGSERKIYACAHPDLGWSGGIAAAWLLSTQGIYIFKCPSCGVHGSPYPTKQWPNVPRFRLSYERAEEGTPVNERLALAGKTAAIACPNGCVLDEGDREQMIAEGSYMHKGQDLDLDAGILGDPDKNESWGFWVHVLMSNQVKLSNLARQLEGALEHKQRTGKNDKLKQVLVRTFGEAFESEADLKGIDATSLKRRTSLLSSVETDRTDFQMGVAPKGVRFITCAVDVGHRKLDVLLRGYDLVGRSWLIDRYTIRQRMHEDGILRDLDLVNVQKDWTVLNSIPARLIPMQDRPGWALPIAVMFIDSSDGNITAKAYQYASESAKMRWGSWPRVRLLKGVSGKRDHLKIRPDWLSIDNDGKKIDPPVAFHTAGVDALKDDIFGNDDGFGYLLVDDGSPGQIYFPTDFPSKAYDELFNEPKIEGVYVRNGPNETIDLLAYTECGRLLLKPDRESIRWDDSRMPSGQTWSEEMLPAWARPVDMSEEGGEERSVGGVAVKAPQRNIFDRFNDLNKR